MHNDDVEANTLKMRTRHAYHLWQKRKVRLT